MLKILCQFASERKSVDAEFFLVLAFSSRQFFSLRLNRKQRNFAYVFVVKKAEDK